VRLKLFYQPDQLLFAEITNKLFVNSASDQLISLKMAKRSEKYLFYAKLYFALLASLRSAILRKIKMDNQLVTFLAMNHNDWSNKQLLGHFCSVS